MKTNRVLVYIDEDSHCHVVDVTLTVDCGETLARIARAHNVPEEKSAEIKRLVAGSHDQEFDELWTDLFLSHGVPGFSRSHCGRLWIQDLLPTLPEGTR